MADSIRDRYIATMRRRINAQLDAMSLPHWSRRDTLTVCERLYYVAGEGISDSDLRVYVRITNRELIGRNQHDS